MALKKLAFFLLDELPVSKNIVELYLQFIYLSKIIIQTN